MNLSECILRTPLIRFRPAQSGSVGEIILKPENLQPFGSYKIRGVVAAAAVADPKQLHQGLFAASAGNMAQAVAFVAQSMNIPCRIYVPDAAPAVKKAAIKKLGAELVELPFPELWAFVRKPHQGEGLFIHPVFTPGLLDGYGTIGHEIMQDLSDADAVVIPFGVGGLTIGVATVLRKIKPDISIYACEPVTAAPLTASLEAGKGVQINRVPSFVDAIGVPEVLPEVFDLVKPLIAGSIVITLEEAKSALHELYYQHKLVGEGAAGVGLAAAKKVSKDKGHRKVVCIVSGGNIAPEVMKEII